MKTNIPLKESPQRGWLMALLVTGMIVCYAQRGALSVAAPQMIKELHLSRQTMGVLLSAFFWSYAGMQIPAGWLVDRFGVRWAYTLGYVVWLSAAALTGMAKSQAALILARMGLGVGQSVAFPASARAVANWFQERERGAVTAAYLTGVRLGTALIGAVGFALLARYGLKGFFLATGLVPVIWLLPWLKFMGKWEKGAALASAGGRAGMTRPGVSFLESLLLLKQRSMFGIFLGFFAYDYAWFVYLTWLPGYLVLERKFTPREMSIYSSIPYIAMSVIILVSGLLSDGLVRRGYSEMAVRKTFIIIGMAISCLIVPAGMVEDKMTAVWLLTIALCGLGIATPQTWTLTQVVCAKPIVGTASGIQNFGGNLGGVLAPVLTGYIADRTHSFALALGLTGVILLIGILSYGFLISQKVGVEKAEP